MDENDWLSDNGYRTFLCFYNSSLTIHLVFHPYWSDLSSSSHSNQFRQYGHSGLPGKSPWSDWSIWWPDSGLLSQPGHLVPCWIAKVYKNIRYQYVVSPILPSYVKLHTKISFFAKDNKLQSPIFNIFAEKWHAGRHLWTFKGRGHLGALAKKGAWGNQKLLPWRRRPLFDWQLLIRSRSLGRHWYWASTDRQKMRVAHAWKISGLKQIHNGKLILKKMDSTTTTTMMMYIL